MTRILLALCGLTPQIITETLYALHQEGQLPQRVILLTTRAGRERCLKRLLGENGGLRRFFADYGLAASACRLDASDILTPAPAVDDITTLEDSVAFQTLCMEQAFQATREAEVAVDFSLAGGRKTMGASLALAAQCYARPGDRLFHVLVSPPDFESQPDFFYPPPVPASLPRPAPPLPPLSTDQARITLAHLPLVRLRPCWPPSLLEQPQRPETFLAGLSLAHSPCLRFHVRQRSLSLGGRTCRLPPVEFSLLFSFALHKLRFSCTGDCPSGCTACYMDMPTVLEHGRKVEEIYRKVCTTSAARSTTGILNLSAENFMTYKAKLHRQLRQQLGELASYAEIASHGTRPNVRYGLRLARGHMLMDEEW